MKKLKKGFVQAIISVVSGIVLTYAITTMVNKAILPDYSLIIFTFLSLIANIVAIKKMGRWGLFYTVGWLVGTLLFKRMLSIPDFILNIIFPVLILVIRTTVKVRQFAR